MYNWIVHLRYEWRRKETENRVYIHRKCVYSLITCASFEYYTYCKWWRKIVENSFRIFFLYFTVVVVVVFVIEARWRYGRHDVVFGLVECIIWHEIPWLSGSFICGTNWMNKKKMQKGERLNKYMKIYRDQVDKQKKSPNWVLGGCFWNFMSTIKIIYV